MSQPDQPSARLVQIEPLRKEATAAQELQLLLRRQLRQPLGQSCQPLGRIAIFKEEFMKKNIHR